MRLGAVVVQHRDWSQAVRTLDALLGGARTPDHVLVVDNCSRDGSADVIRKRFRHVEVVEAAVNRGAAAGMNLGADHLLAAGMEAVLLLTADCVLAAPALAHLEARLTEAPAVGAVGPLLGRSSAPAEVFSAGGLIDRRTWTPLHVREPRLLEEWAGTAPRSCEWLDGSCVLLRAEALRQAGPLDERYFHYFEDVDHHLRLKSLGWGVECLPAAVAWQEPGQPRRDLWVRNRLRFLAHHAPAPVLARELARQGKYFVQDLRRGERGQAAARARAVCCFLGGRWGPLP